MKRVASAVEVLGTSLAAMVCADVLAREGIPVALRCDDPEKLGRSFRGLLVDGVRLEAGARLLEFSYGDPEVKPDPDPRGYEPGDHRWHMGLVREYLEGLVPNPVEVRVWLDREGRTSPDFLLSSNLHDLPAACSRFELAKIERDALSACNVLGRDGIDQRTLQTMGYRAASITLHGWTLHKTFVEPILDAILGPEVEIPALDHRRVWLPLFTPGEILDACRGQSSRPVRKFHAGMADAVEALVARVEPLLGASLPAGEHELVRDTVRGPVGSVRMRFVWIVGPRPVAEPTVVWKVGGPVFRGSQLGRAICWEMRDGVRAPRGVFCDRTADYALREEGRVDAQLGLIGVGSLNEQICQGISCAAWRLTR